MTSSTGPERRRPSLSRLLPSRTPGRYSDPEERFQRYVTLGFIGLIVIDQRHRRPRAPLRLLGCELPVPSRPSTASRHQPWPVRGSRPPRGLPPDAGRGRRAHGPRGGLHRPGRRERRRLPGDPGRAAEPRPELARAPRRPDLPEAARAGARADARRPRSSTPRSPPRALAPKAARSARSSSGPAGQARASPTPEGRQEAFTQASAAIAALRAGAPFDQVLAPVRHRRRRGRRRPRARPAHRPRRPGVGRRAVRRSRPVASPTS